MSSHEYDDDAAFGTTKKVNPSALDQKSIDRLDEDGDYVYHRCRPLVEPDSSLMREIDKLKKIWTSAITVPKLLPPERYRLFERLRRLKEVILEKLFLEDNGLRALMSLCVPRRMFVESGKKNGRYIGAQYFISAQGLADSDFDPFELLKDADTFTTCLQRITIADGPLADEQKAEVLDEDDELIDFNLTTNELAILIIKTASGYLTACDDRKNELRAKLVDQTMQLKPGHGFLKALARFGTSPEIPTLLVKLERCQQKIIDAHIRNVCFAAHFSVKRGAHTDICIQMGMLGLMRAIDVYEYRVGKPFWEYCWRYIAGALQRGIPKENNLIYIPNKPLADAKMAVDGNADTDGVEVMAAREILNLNDMVSLDRSYEDRDGKLREDWRIPHDRRDPEMMVSIKNDMASILRRAGLSEKQQQVIQLRYLTNDMVLEEIGDLMLPTIKKGHNKGNQRGITRERVRQIELKAIEKLRLYLLHSEITYSEVAAMLNVE